MFAPNGLPAHLHNPSFLRAELEAGAGCLPAWGGLSIKLALSDLGSCQGQGSQEEKGVQSSVLCPRDRLPRVFCIASEMAPILISPGKRAEEGSKTIGGFSERQPQLQQDVFVSLPSDTPTSTPAENELLESISLEYSTFFFYHISAMS